MRKSQNFLNIFAVLFTVIFAGFTINSYATTITLVKSGGSGTLTFYPNVASTMSFNSGNTDATVTCNGTLCTFPETTPLSWVGGGDIAPILSTKYGTITNPYGMWCSLPFKRGICNYPPTINYLISIDSTYYAAWDCPGGYYGRNDFVCAQAGIGYWSPGEDYIENSFVYRANNRYKCPTGYTTETTTASSIQDCVKITSAESDCGPNAKIVENITTVSNISYTNLDGITFNYTSSDSITTNKTVRNIVPLAGYYYTNDINAADMCPEVGVGYWSPGEEIETSLFTFYPYRKYSCPLGYTTDNTTSDYFNDCKLTESVSDQDCGNNANITLYVQDISEGSFICNDNICQLDESSSVYTNGLSSINNVSATAGHYYIDAAGVGAVTTNNYTGDICPLTGIGYWSPGETTVIDGFSFHPNHSYRCPDDFTTSSTGAGNLTDCFKTEQISDTDCGSDPYIEKSITGLSFGPNNCDLSGFCESGTPIITDNLNIEPIAGHYYAGNPYASDACPVVGIGYWSPGSIISFDAGYYYPEDRYECPNGSTTDTDTSDYVDDCYKLTAIESDCGPNVYKREQYTTETGTLWSEITLQGIPSPAAGYYYDGTALSAGQTDICKTCAGSTSGFNLSIAGDNLSINKCYKEKTCLMGYDTDTAILNWYYGGTEPTCPTVECTTNPSEYYPVDEALGASSSVQELYNYLYSNNYTNPIYFGKTGSFSNNNQCNVCPGNGWSMFLKQDSDSFSLTDATGCFIYCPQTKPSITVESNTTTFNETSRDETVSPKNTNFDTGTGGYTVGYYTNANGTGGYYNCKYNATCSSAGYHSVNNGTANPYCQANSYMIHFNTNGGSPDGVSDMGASFDSTIPSFISIIAHKRTGYTLNGYYNSANGGEKWYECNETSCSAYNNKKFDSIGDITLYAQWTPNGSTCPAGQYLPMGQLECTECTNGNYCPGGYYEFNTLLNQGINSCPVNYTDGLTGLESENECPKNCPNYSLSNGTAISYNQIVLYPENCDYSCLTSDGNPGEIIGTMCKETGCQTNYEMINGNCVLCNREHALTYKSTGNCRVESCENGWHANGQKCELDIISCSVPNASVAEKNWNNELKSYSICNVKSCNSGYHISSNACVIDSQSCSIENGIGIKEWNNTTNNWNNCSVISCNPGYTSDASETNETSKPCGVCKNKYNSDGEISVSSYIDGCEISSCMYQGELYDLQNNECVSVCENSEDDTGIMQWDSSNKKCSRQCKIGYAGW